MSGDVGESEHDRPAVRQLCGLVLHLVIRQQAEWVEAEVARLPLIVALHHVVDLREPDGLKRANPQGQKKHLIAHALVEDEIHLMFCGVDRPMGSKPTLPIMPK